MRLTLWLLVVASSLQAGSLDPDALGVRFGASATSLDELYTQTDVLLRWELHKTPPQDHDRWLGVDLDCSAGALAGQGNAGLVASLGPLLRFGQGDCPLTAEVGLSPTFISKRVFDQDDFGSHLQFTTRGGFSLRLSRRTSLSYWIQHMSNADLASPNPGLNLHTLTFVVRL